LNKVRSIRGRYRTHQQAHMGGRARSRPLVICGHDGAWPSIPELHRCRNDKKLPHSAAVGHHMLKSISFLIRKDYGKRVKMILFGEWDRIGSRK
jgi:hypothetical protein